MNDRNAVEVLFEGDMACFTRPEFRNERRSYDVMTRTAAIGALSAIFWKPEISWEIDKIEVLNPISFANFTTNEVNVGPTNRPYSASDNRVQRNNSVLRDVAYIVTAHFEIVRESRENHRAYLDQIMRRVNGGRCWQQPYFGLREMMANFRPVTDDDRLYDRFGEPREAVEDRDLGLMLHSFDWSDPHNPSPVFRPARLIDRVVHYGDAA